MRFPINLPNVIVVAVAAAFVCIFNGAATVNAAALNKTIVSHGSAIAGVAESDPVIQPAQRPDAIAEAVVASVQHDVKSIPHSVIASSAISPVIVPPVSVHKSSNSTAVNRSSLIVMYADTLYNKTFWPVDKCSDVELQQLCAVYADAVSKYHDSTLDSSLEPLNMKAIEIAARIRNAELFPTPKHFCDERLSQMPATSPLADNSTCYTLCRTDIYSEYIVNPLCRRISAVYEASRHDFDGFAAAAAPAADTAALAPAPAAVAASIPAQSTISLRLPNTKNIGAAAAVQQQPRNAAAAASKSANDASPVVEKLFVPQTPDIVAEQSQPDPNEIKNAIALDAANLDIPQNDDDDEDGTDLDSMDGAAGPGGANNDADGTALGADDADTKIIKESGITGSSSSGAKNNKLPTQSDPFVGNEESNFFSYFMGVLVICVFVYVLYHNRRFVFALLLEGRRRNGGHGVGRRKHTAAYRKLDSNLEEAISSSTAATGGGSMSLGGGGGGGGSGGMAGNSGAGTGRSQPIIY